jgi:hypothetical protein
VFAAILLHCMDVAPASESPPARQHLQALLLALVCAVLFLRDGLWPGRALVPFPPEQFDVVRAEATAAGRFDPVDAARGNAAGADKYLQSLCWDRVLHDRLRAGETPRWTRDIAAGVPFVPQMAQVYEPVNLLLLLLPSTEWYGVWYLLHLVLFGWLAWWFLRRLGCHHGSALLGLVAAVLGLWTQCKVHHNVILTAALPLWPMLAAVHALVAEGRAGVAGRRAIGALSLWTGIAWLSGFAVVSLQVSYLVVGFAALLAWQRPRGERLRPLLAVAAGLGLGGVLSLAHMLPVLLASATSSRASGFDPVMLAANGLEWDHALGALWPDLLCWAGDVFHADPGGADRFVTRMPWSQLVLLAQPLHPITQSAFQSWVETSFAVGTAPLACAALAFGDRRHRAAAAFFAGAALLAFGFACADEPFLSLARFVPGLAAADLRRSLFTVAMGLVVLTALGADALLAGARRWPAWLLLAVVAAGALLGLWFAADHADEPSFTAGTAELFVADRDHPVVQQIGGDVQQAIAFVQRSSEPGEWRHNRDHLQATAWRALLAAAAAAVLLWRRGRGPVLAIALAATAAELLHAGLGTVQTVPAERVATPPVAMAPVLAAAEPNGVRPRLVRLAAATESRIASWYPGNLPGYHGIEDATGYNPLPSARFERYFTLLEPDRAGKVSVAFGGAGVGALHDAASLRHPLADLFGIRFVLTREDVPVGAELVDRTPPGTGGFRVLERTTALPRATFVREVDLVPPGGDLAAVLGRSDRPVRARMVLEDPDAPKPTPAAPADVTSEVTVREHRDERVVVAVRTSHDGYLRLADPYDAGWRATVDGAPTPVFAADHYLRAVFVPAGAHEVVFTYDAPRVLWPERLALLALLVVVGLWFAPLRRRP